MPLVKWPRYREMLGVLRKRLPEKKVRHCIFVAEYLTSFAEVAGVEHDAGAAAGLLHDLCRTMPPEELEDLAEQYQIEPPPAFRERPVLLHGPVAAEELQRDFDFDSPELYEAIYWHTTGRPGYCRLGQALYLADFAEPSRKYPEAEEVRRLLRKEGFDTALRYAAETKLVYARAKSTDNAEAEAFLAWLREEAG